MTWRARLSAVALFTTIAGPALAEPTKRECIDANATAQVEQKAGRLRASRRLLQSCAVRACPAQVRKDCGERLEALTGRIPSLVVEAKDGSGADLTAVTVEIDGELLTTSLDGVAIELDPGEHRFRFDAADRQAVERTIVIREGDVARRERVVLVAKAPVVVAPRVVVEPAPVRPDTGHDQRVAGIAVGSAGVLGIGIGAIFGALANSKWSSVKKTCGPRYETECNVPKRDEAAADGKTAHTQATVSTIGFVAGAALVAGGAVLYLTAPKKSAVGIAPSPTGALLVGRF